MSGALMWLGRVCGAWAWLPALLSLGLVACSSGPEKMKPVDLPPPAKRVNASQMWTTQVGASARPLALLSLRGKVYAAGGEGTVAAIDSITGVDVWRVNLKQPLATGPGSDGEVTAVVTQANELVALREGRESWRVTLPAASYTAPLVAGRRVFVLTADRTVVAFDARTGVRLWVQSRPGEPLVLRQSGVVLAVGDTLVVGLSGRLVGLDPSSGLPRWEAPIATSRGTNEIERLVDLVSPASRLGDQVCARAFNSSVACVDTAAGRVQWSKPVPGATGVHGDDSRLFGSDADGRLYAWGRDKGDRLWDIERLKFRELSAPLALGRLLVVGDGTGLVHLLASDDGSEITRLSTDGSAIAVAPVLSGPALVVLTRNGGLFAWRSE
jgi:outer membrane protein assembly factor BamB